MLLSAVVCLECYVNESYAWHVSPRARYGRARLNSARAHCEPEHDPSGSPPSRSHSREPDRLRVRLGSGAYSDGIGTCRRHQLPRAEFLNLAAGCHRKLLHRDPILSSDYKRVTAMP